VSKPEGNGGQPERAAFAELEGAVSQALDRLATVTARATELEETRTELEEIVRRFTGDEAEAGRMLSRLGRLEAENEELKSRLAEGRAGVDRLLKKIRFLEEQR
jgi:septal ring factor EnvC (AmiA/AmiB activator)